jgi:hypothetical protein
MHVNNMGMVVRTKVAVSVSFQERIQNGMRVFSAMVKIWFPTRKPDGENPLARFSFGFGMSSVYSVVAGRIRATMRDRTRPAFHEVHLYGS